VLGHTPARRERAFLGRIALVMGNRNQLQWDLPALDSFELNRAVYGIARPDFVRQRDELIDLLDLADLVSKPVRNLSLGERMKAEIAGCLLHRPAVLFLDEPTLGLDVTMQRRIRAFLADYAPRHGATILLTSHYMADVEALCRRVVLIHHGSLLFDGGLATLADRFSGTRTLVVRFDGEPPTTASLAAFGREVGRDGASVTLLVDKGRVAEATGELLARHAVADLTIEDPPIDDVIERAFAAPATP
jgi:ABC-2 type transport system ATP-binding protein